jgi:hypothetical protein
MRPALGPVRQRTEVVRITFLRRLLGLASSGESVDTPTAVVSLPADAPEPAPVFRVACPNCGAVLDPPPDRSRLCPSCRHRIVVRHSDGNAIYLTEAAVEVFQAERQLEIERQAWTLERLRWLHLARAAGAPAELRRRAAVAQLSIEAVRSSRDLYLDAAESAVRAARRAKRWDEVARIRRRQAAALFEEAGGSAQPADEIVALHREGVAATLRSLATVSREAELVGASCCQACRIDNERIFRIADELRTPRLPHAGCPRGLCACDWWPAVPDPATKRRRRRRSTASQAAAVAGAGAAATPADYATSVAEVAADNDAEVVAAGQPPRSPR